MDRWFVDDNEYIRLWAWLKRAPVEDRDARCPPADARPRVEAFRPAGVSECVPGSPFFTRRGPAARPWAAGFLPVP